MNDYQSLVVPIIVALIGAGLGGFLRSIYLTLRSRWRSSSPEERERRGISEELDNADKSSLLLVRENTALAARNQELYAAMTSTDARHAREREEWHQERAAMRAEIDELERKLRALLDELVQLRTRHT